MFPVYSVTHVPGLYPALHSVGLLNVLQGVRLRGPTRKRVPPRVAERSQVGAFVAS